MLSATQPRLIRELGSGLYEGVFDEWEMLPVGELLSPYIYELDSEKASEFYRISGEETGLTRAVPDDMASDCAHLLSRMADRMEFPTINVCVLAYPSTDYFLISEIDLVSAMFYIKTLGTDVRLTRVPHQFIKVTRADSYKKSVQIFAKNASRLDDPVSMLTLPQIGLHGYDMLPRSVCRIGYTVWDFMQDNKALWDTEER